MFDCLYLFVFFMFAQSTVVRNNVVLILFLLLEVNGQMVLDTLEPVSAPSMTAFLSSLINWCINLLESASC